MSSIASEAARAALDAKTKPHGSLGRLEELAVRVAGIRGDTNPRPLRSAIVLAAADHGVAARGVSAYPQEVTRQMLANFAAGGAAVCVLARRADAELRVFDLGVGSPTADISAGPAMSRERAAECVARGRRVAEELVAEGFGLVALGEMGIGNTTSAAALAARLLGADPAAVVGRGTGVDDAGLARKVAVVRRALAANEDDDALGTLARLGGFEIAFLAGVAIGASARAVVVLLDGFITGVAALVAERLSAGARSAMVAAHLSPEPGHRLVLDALELEPLLDLGLRLGEGSGAALALPLIQASLAILDEMATFESAGVSGRDR